MNRRTSQPLRAALEAAARTGLRVGYPGEPPWIRVSCSACGGVLDLPLVFAPSSLEIADVDQAPGVARRVDAFASRHQPGEIHQ